ncbi:MAG TPA: thiamine pyrophosphate-binding protein [Xanthobacteraceae bacterium]|nr:thiamine pyrophosphate-binding protein [Xanthobacteraceae bacterium]
MPLMSGGDAVVKSLLGHGVSTVYCLPGVQSDHLFNAMFDAGDAIRVVHTRHEQGAAYMALGAALATGCPAAYSVVPGPGFLNSSAALATAYSTGAQVLALIGQIPSRAIGKGFGFLHEINDQTSILRTLTNGPSASSGRKPRPAWSPRRSSRCVPGAGVRSPSSCRPTCWAPRPRSRCSPRWRRPRPHRSTRTRSPRRRPCSRKPNVQSFSSAAARSTRQQRCGRSPSG